jgi:hypothetical protein
MRVNRKLLYVGVFLAAIGGVIVVADLASTDADLIRETLRLWPLALVAIGIGIALRRSQFSLPAGMLAAAVPGLVLGGAFALAPRIAVDCGVAGGPATTATTEQGSFDGPARVFVSTGCGTLTVDTAQGASWTLERGDPAGTPPIVDATAVSLSVEASSQRWWQRFDDDRDDWHLTLPTSAIEDLAVVVNAGDGQLHLRGAQIDRLELMTNAGAAFVDLSEARVSSLVGTVNAGQLTYRLPAGNITGMFEVNAGGLEICVPSETGLRVHQDGNLAGVTIDGQHVSATDWQSANYASAPNKADLDIEVNLGSVEINPIGGCR